LTSSPAAKQIQVFWGAERAAEGSSAGEAIKVQGEREVPDMAKNVTTETKEIYTAIDDNGKPHEIEIEVTIEEEPHLDGKGMDRTEIACTHKMAANGNHINVMPDGTLVELATGRMMRRL